MGALKGSNISSDPQKWHNVFNVLVGISQAQQIQIESLAKERKLLENVIKSQHERRVSEFNLFQDQISQVSPQLLGIFPLFLVLIYLCEFYVY